MYISDDEKRQIIRELAQGSIQPLPGVTASLPKDEDNLQNYQNFDDFAQRSTWNQPQDDVTRAFFERLKKG